MTSKTQNFTKDYLPIAVKVGGNFGINPAVILAQAAVEGDFGTSFAVKNRKNHFGITAAGSPNEYWDGSKSQSSVSGLWFRIYKSHEDSFSDFARLIKSKYPTCFKLSYNTQKYAECIANSPYISEANGDNRQSYQQQVAKYASIFQPVVNEYQQNALRKKKIAIITITVSLLILIGISTYVIVKKQNK